jgi:hypothetical protein
MNEQDWAKLRSLETYRLAERPELELKVDLHRLDSAKGRAEFVKDCIAIGNAAYETGRPSLMLFGITDDKHWNGILSCLEAADPTEAESVLSGFEQRAGQILKDYISPNLRYQIFKKQDQGKKWFAAIEFAASDSLSDSPYRLKKDLESFHTNDAWVRRGAHKFPVSGANLRTAIVSSKHYPRITREEWRAIATAMHGELEALLEPRDDAQSSSRAIA